MPSGELLYSTLRDSIIKNLTDVPSIPVDFQPKGATSDELHQTAVRLGLINNVRCRTLSIGKRIELVNKVNQASSRNEDKKLTFTFNDDIEAAGWILHNCICDEAGNAIFAIDDLSIIVNKFEALCFYLLWEALAVNGYTRQAEQDLVGNSDGTEQQSA